MTDLLIRGATVIDGTGTPGVRASVVVDRGRIASIEADGAVATADRVLDAGGLVLAPGYIDMHSHADFTLPSYPAAINSLAQGVTTEVIGNCGYSPAPLAADPVLAARQRAECHGLGSDLDWAWRSFGEYLARLDAARPAACSAWGWSARRSGRPPRPSSTACGPRPRRPWPRARGA